MSKDDRSKIEDSKVNLKTQDFENSIVKNSKIKGHWSFENCSLEDCEFEGRGQLENVDLKNVIVRGNYIMMDGREIRISNSQISDHFKLSGDDIEIKDSGFSNNARVHGTRLKITNVDLCDDARIVGDNMRIDGISAHAKMDITKSCNENSRLRYVWENGECYTVIE